MTGKKHNKLTAAEYQRRKKYEKKIRTCYKIALCCLLAGILMVLIGNLVLLATENGMAGVVLLVISVVLCAAVFFWFKGREVFFDSDSDLPDIKKIEKTAIVLYAIFFVLFVIGAIMYFGIDSFIEIMKHGRQYFYD